MVVGSAAGAPDGPAGAACLADRAMRMLGATGQAPVVVCAEVAGVAGAAIPAGAELLPQPSGDGLGAGTADRLYELRVEGPTTGPAALSSLDWARRAVPRPLVGRSEVSGRLAAAWREALRGEARTVLLRGERGIGKTAVAAELALAAAAAGALVLYGRWDRPHRSPGRMFREVVVASGGGTARGTGDLVRTHLRLDARLDAGAHEGVDAAVVCDAFGAWLDRLADRRPVLLVLDDLPAAEPAAAVVLDHLHHALGSAPSMVVGTMHPDEAEGPGRPPVDVGPAEAIDLTGLTVADVAVLAARLLGHPVEPGDEGVVWLAAATAGNPLFVLHALRGVRAGTPPGVALAAARRRLPDALVDVVRWRVAQLPAATREALAAAAATRQAGEVDLDHVAGAVRVPPVVARNALDPALRSGILAPGTRRAGSRARHETFRFTHDVVRRVLVA